MHNHIAAQRRIMQRAPGGVVQLCSGLYVVCAKSTTTLYDCNINGLVLESCLGQKAAGICGIYRVSDERVCDCAELRPRSQPGGIGYFKLWTAAGGKKISSAVSPSRQSYTYPSWTRAVAGGFIVCIPSRPGFQVELVPKTSPVVYIQSMLMPHAVVAYMIENTKNICTTRCLVLRDRHVDE